MLPVVLIPSQAVFLFRFWSHNLYKCPVSLLWSVYNEEILITPATLNSILYMEYLKAIKMQLFIDTFVFF
jgi:hypothetical protein